MQLKIYTVYDSKVEAYLQPFYVRSKGEAIRAFTETVNDPQSLVGKHPADYTLFEIGEFDDQTAKIKSLAANISLGTAIEFLRSPDGTTMLPPSSATNSDLRQL